MNLSVRLTAIGLLASLALPVTASAQGGDTAYCQALSDKYQRYVVGTSGSGRQSSPNLSAVEAASKCNSNAGGSIPVLEKALKDARLDLPPRS